MIMNRPFSCLAAAALLVAGCNIQFATPSFPKDTAPGDSAGSDAGLDVRGPDRVGPDRVEPDLAGQACEDMGGLCVGEGDELELNAEGCPWGYERVDTARCGDDAHCCVVSPDCDGAGAVFGVDDEGVGCCPGLDAFDVCHVEGYGTCACSGDEYVCTVCGDGTCDAWENPCVCPDDCPLENLCVEEGGACKLYCPDGWTPMDSPGCPAGKKCCMENEPECIDAGQPINVSDDSQFCCGGLAFLPDSWPDGQGECSEQEDSKGFCSDCGNGGPCDPWESGCTCPQDCPTVVPVGCDPWNGDITQCDEQQVCVAPPYACLVQGPIGSCFDKFSACPYVAEPVCTCDGKDFINPCMANKAGQSVAWFGSCTGDDGMDCVGLGESAPGPMSGMVCCGDLDQMDAMAPDGDGCLAVPGFVCVKCGDGICGPGENFCICSGDCGNFEDPVPGG